jgi:hypothetical protein
MPKAIEIDGQKFKVDVTDDGMFRALHDGDPISAQTYADLSDKLRKRLRRAKVRLALPVTLLGVTMAPPPTRERSWMPDKPLRPAQATVDAVITGIHAQNRDVLIDLPDGTKHRASGYAHRNEGTIARRLTPEEAATYVQLAKAADEADTALAAFVEKVGITDAREWVREQVEAAEKAKPDTEVDVPTFIGDPRIDALPRRTR